MSACRVRLGGGPGRRRCAHRREYDIREIVATVVYKATDADTFDPQEYGRSFNPPAD